ncbi:hypothetical protein [Rheinheimera sp.]|uniref:hypothetical protein n=1 Tax=Rheinheimera sp. TaxID=1869214 RepID=UPI00307F2EE1
MKKYEILYDWPIEEIRRLSDSEIAASYAAQLVEPELSRFVELTEKIRLLGADLAKAKAERAHFTKWGEIRNYIEEYDAQFSSFPPPSVDKLRMSLLLAHKLSEFSPPLDMTDIEADVFEIREITQPVPNTWFCRENSLSLSDSVALLTLSDISVVANDIMATNMSPNFLFHLIATLNLTPELPSFQMIFVKKMTPQIDSMAIDAFARLAILSTGKAVHSARRYTNPPNILNINEIKPGAAYHQWIEILNVLSEYNSRDDALLKFLTIYHVIENFMFKRPIVELEQKMNGAMFSIRDFKRLYDNVKIKEEDALKNLFQEVFKMEALPRIKFKDHIVTRWERLVPTMSKEKIDDSLRLIGLSFSFNFFKGESALSCFSKLIYTLRNTIVHNKETEFHLTYASLDMHPSLCKIIEEFALPSLEEICFYLISKPNQVLWYQNKDICLYQ